ncbi:MAG: acyltransferase [Clostridia bacterium]|nr:acyltransferase [Clostridia bacterium]
MVVSKESIKIGKYTSFGPNVLIYDHDHNIHSGEDIHDSGFVTDGVTIGDNVWIGANTVILRGSVLGDGCVVGAGSVIKGTYPPDSVIIQKRTENITVKKRGKEVVVC